MLEEHSEQKVIHSASETVMLPDWSELFSKHCDHGSKKIFLT